MSNLLFTEVSVEEQELVCGGVKAISKYDYFSQNNLLIEGLKFSNGLAGVSLSADKVQLTSKLKVSSDFSANLGNLIAAGF